MQANGSSKTIAQHHAHDRIQILRLDQPGLFVTYRLAGPAVAEFVRQLRLLAESRLAEVEQTTRNFLESRLGFEQVNSEELLRRVRRGEVTVLDVRPAEEYGAGHLPRALCVPLHELETRMKELPKDRDIVAYCRGPYCAGDRSGGQTPAKGFPRGATGYGRGRLAGARTSGGKGHPQNQTMMNPQSPLLQHKHFQHWPGIADGTGPVKE